VSFLMLFSGLRWLSSPKRVLAVIGVATTTLTLARVIVLVVEAYSAVWAERAADRELIQLCESGTGSLSHDFRALCLKKRAEQAAPVLLKALLRAVTTAFTDFVEVLSSPTRVIMLVLFTITGVAAPVVKAMSQLAVDHLRTRRRRRLRDRFITCENGDSSSGEDEPHKPTVIMLGEPQTPASAAGARMMGMITRRMSSRSNLIRESSNINDGYDPDSGYDTLTHRNRW
jgi:hypothetical protein